MFCAQCGEPLPDDANFCPSCGSPVPSEDALAVAAGDAPTGTIDTGEVELAASVDELPALPEGVALLVVTRGPNAGSRYLLDRDATTIGRHPDSHVFLDDVTVSRHHARIDREDGEFVLHDLGSLNGTYLAGERVDRRHLQAGAEMQIGRFKLLFVGASP